MIQDDSRVDFEQFLPLQSEFTVAEDLQASSEHEIVRVESDDPVDVEFLGELNLSDGWNAVGLVLTVNSAELLGRLDQCGENCHVEGKRVDVLEIFVELIEIWRGTDCIDDVAGRSIVLQSSLEKVLIVNVRFLDHELEMSAGRLEF